MFENTPELHKFGKLAVVLAGINPGAWLFENNPELNEVAKAVVVLAGVDPGLWLFESAPELNEFAKAVAVPGIDPGVWLFENAPELNEVADGVVVLAGGNPVDWLLNKSPELHGVPKLEEVPARVTAAFSWDNFIPLFLVSLNILFSLVWDSAAEELPPLVAFALSQLTTSLNFSWKGRLNGKIF